jgi:ABC-type transport system involved in multi-copper enzyme maturation permease subunit
MFRKTLALLVRALRVDARSIRPHLVRMGLLATILWLLYLAHASVSFTGAPGLTLFTSLAHVNIWFITIIGVTYFSSAITEEKEERTLGLLRMADIGSGSILLGKWAPRIVGMLSLIAVQFPFTLLAITLGGVTQAQVNAVYVALLLHLLSVGTWSLVASVYCRNTGSACRAAFIALFVRWFIPYMAGLFATLSVGAGGKAPVLDGIAMINEASVHTLTGRALATTFAEGPFPTAAAWWLGESAFLFVLSWLIFDPCTQGDILSDAQPSMWTRLTARNKRSNHRRAWTSAIAGKDFMLLAGGGRGSLLRFTVYMGIVFSFLLMMNIFGVPVTLQEAGGALLGFGFGFVALDIIQSAAKVFRVELQEQTWSALMMLPRNINGVAWSKIGGCALGWWPSLLMITLGSLLVPNVMTSILDGMFDPDMFFGVVYFGMQIVLFLQLTVLTSISLTWAAWPLAAPLSFFMVFVCNALVLTCLAASAVSGGGGIQVVFFLLSGISLVAAIILYNRIGAKLLAKASDGA